MKNPAAGRIPLFYALYALFFFTAFPCFSRGEKQAPPPQPEQKPPVEETKITLLAAGDNLIHDIIYLAARQTGEAGASYDFAPCYEHIAPLVKKADIAFVNQETVLGGTALGLSGYPVFNTPQETGTALAGAGFNVVNHASNHSMDRGEEAVTATMNFWDEVNKTRSAGGKDPVLMLGFFRSKEERETKKSIITKNGISVGFLSYTYGLNGYKLPKDKPWLVPLIDAETMAKEMDALRPLCDILAVSMHWGTEFSHEANDAQKELVKLLAGHKADLVLGHHPHVTQGCETVDRPDGGKLTVFYSLGDLLSHTQTSSSPDTVLGALAVVNIVKRREGAAESTAVTGASVIPTVCHYGKGRRSPFTAYPLWDYSDELAALHYKSEEIDLEYLWKKSREIFGTRLLENNPF
jgi:poly-gamma-glutamate synthesis protein (capsule biosynthesis protein)